MRLFVGLLGALACALIASHNASLNVDIVRMARYNSSNLAQNGSSGQCVSATNSTDEAPVVRGEFDWNESLPNPDTIRTSDGAIRRQMVDSGGRYVSGSYSVPFADNRPNGSALAPQTAQTKHR
jgi:hypothetical protein